MSKTRSPNRDKAYNIYLEHNGNITSKQIAEILKEKVSNINTWRSKDHWKDKLNGKVGAPYKNKNAVGNRGGGAPRENQNNRKHGFYSKYLPKTVYNIFKDIEEMSSLEILWNNIKLKFAAIIRSQKIMYVKSKNDKTKELKKVVWGKSPTEEFEVQFAWDKQERFLKAQSVAMRTLSKMIQEYEELLHKNWDLATEEQKARVEKLKIDIENIKGNNEEETKTWADAIQEIAAKRRDKYE